MPTMTAFYCLLNAGRVGKTSFIWDCMFFVHCTIDFFPSIFSLAQVLISLVFLMVAWLCVHNCKIIGCSVCVLSKRSTAPVFSVDNNLLICGIGKTILDLNETYMRLKCFIKIMNVIIYWVIWVSRNSSLFNELLIIKDKKWSQCSVVEHCVSSAKGCGFNSQGTNILMKKKYNLNAL